MIRRVCTTSFNLKLSVSYQFSDPRWRDLNWSEKLSSLPKVSNPSLLSSYSQTAPKPMISVAPTVHNSTGEIQHNLWSDKILPPHGDDKRHQNYSSDRKQLLGCNKIFSTRPSLNRSHSVSDPCPGRLSRLDQTRRSVSLAERQMALSKVTLNSDSRSSSDRICRDNILQLLSDRLQAGDGQQGR